MEPTSEKNRNSVQSQENGKKDSANLLHPEQVTRVQSTSPSTAEDEHLTDSLRTVVIAGEETGDNSKDDKLHTGPKPTEYSADRKIEGAMADSKPNVQTLEAEKSKEEDGEELKLQASVVKDENGFVYYKCRFCGLTFNYMTTLKAHERVHDVDQPYLCGKCGEAFRYMCELEYHCKSHLKQKGYKCECGRTFSQYTDLLYHDHPGEDPDVEAYVPMPAEPAGPVVPSPSHPAIDPTAFPTPEFKEKGYEPKYAMKVYSDIRTRPYMCQYCSKSYPDSR
ncbi:zinc finger protein unc-98 [Ditylenchus destructor]|uniref:Zinc finger protein unc-98 n=1 Tax=Ditylenchus destructor TaxID=166010 RepID=A0AAD4MQQ0_9BILA|nr:zinc finger protein unc-98 [Ditylenchus destructor]